MTSFFGKLELEYVMVSEIHWFWLSEILYFIDLDMNLNNIKVASMNRGWLEALSLPEQNLHSVIILHSFYATLKVNHQRCTDSLDLSSSCTCLLILIISMLKKGGSDSIYISSC